MYLKNLYLKNFRNYKESEAQFSPRLNIFHGDNAQGKTNLLEALYLIATGRSFRTQHLNECILDGESFFFLDAEIIKDSISQQVKLSFDGQTKKLQIDGNSYSTFQPLLGLLPSVLYTPSDIELITGAPNIRRRFLNLHLAQSDPLYVHHLTRFWRAMKQRNCLLRSTAQTGIECFEEEMHLSAAYLWKAREQMVLQLKEPLFTESKRLSNQMETHELHLQAPPKSYPDQLKRHRPRESALGLTLTGPHRDELTLLINQKPARLFASEGQKKTLISSLRFAEWRRLSTQTGTQALMAIDDLGLHLDEAREKILTDALSELGQVFITTPRAHLTGHTLSIQQGQIQI